MKNCKKRNFVFLVIISVFFMFNGLQNINAQTTEKNKVRIKADYVKIMDSISYLDITAASRIEKQNVEVSNIELSVYNETEEDEIEIGSTITNSKGKSRFIIKDLNALIPDSTMTYTLNVSFKGNDAYKKASKSISFKNASISANITVKDSTNFISASLSDLSTNSPIEGESLTVQVQRLIKPLKIGEEFNNTDENGTILVLIEEGIPGVGGNLNIEVVLEDHDDFGTIKKIVHAPVGIPIVKESTYDDRTMWSPRNKTPWFILIFTNLLIFSVWGVIIYLVVNLFKINKS